MTKELFAKLILEAVDNTRFVGGDVVEGISDLLSVLHPVDRNHFAQWGMLEERSTPENCWP